MTNKLSASFIKAFGEKTAQLNPKAVVNEETSRTIIERKISELSSKINAARIGGTGHIGKLTEEKALLQHQLASLNETAKIERISEAMDPVNPKAVKKKFDDRKDKDIDNDGDVDSSDEYLHKRRKAISKAMKKEEVELDEVSNAVKDQLGNIDLSIRDWERRWKNKSAGNPNDMKAPQKIQDLKAQKAALMKKHGIKEAVDLDEVGPKMKPDFVKTQRAKDAAHNAAMGRTATGRKKPVRTMTSTQRSMASMKKEELELDEKVNEKAIKKAVDDGKSMDVIVGMFANKRTTNTDEIRQVVKDYMWNKRMKKEEVENLKELTAFEKKLINQMYDKKGNLTPIGKKVMDAGQKKEEVENLKELTAKQRALAKADDEAKSKDKVSLKKAPWDTKEEVAESVGLTQTLIEKALSKKQQMAAGAALAAKRGDADPSELVGASKEMYDSMSEKDLEDFAKTKHKGLPMKKEEVGQIDEASWNYKGGQTYMVGGNLRYDDKIEYKLSKANADILNNYMRQAKSDAERSKVWTIFWDSKETGDKATGPEKAIAFAKKAIKEEVELDEAYTINHKTFSAAVQHAKAQVEKQGYTIDDDEWDRKVAMGPKKPGTGKTNRYTIELMKNGKPTKRMLQMQVYYDEGRYELNMYVS